MVLSLLTFDFFFFPVQHLLLSKGFYPPPKKKFMETSFYVGSHRIQGLSEAFKILNVELSRQE